MKDKKVVFILGPTGSGKTALAVKLAKRFNGEIISADSRQIFIGLDIGTGKDLEEYKDIKYHLIDICIPEEKFTLFDWLKEARTTLEDIFKRGKLPIVVGGTGLYAKALSEGYAFASSKNQSSKSHAYRQAGKQISKFKFQREELDKMQLKELQKIVENWKLESKNLDLNNPRRLIRAIERSQEGTITTKRKPDFEALTLAINIERSKLYERIDKRVDVRFAKQGMLEEVEGLIRSGVDPDWLKSLGLEYKIITSFIESIKPKEKFQEMTQELKWKTHGYARRQLTWLRQQQGTVWIENAKQATKLVEKFLK